ncbi:MAG: GDSL-type esterase/lipase family protein [Vicinamibacterales bacterium]
MSTRTPEAVGRRCSTAGRALAVVLAVMSMSCGDDPPTAPTAPSLPPIPVLALACPATVLGQSTTGQPVSIQLPAPTASGGVLPVTVSCTPSGTPFPIGTTAVACRAIDAQGSQATCSFNVVVAPPPLPRTSFLAFGDSLTAGEITMPVGGALDEGGFPLFKLVVVPAESYPAELLTLLRNRYVTQAAQFVVTNAGLSREWAADAPKRFATVLAASGAQVVLLMEGTNDLQALGTRGINPALTGLQGMIRQARAAGAFVFVASLPPSRPGGVNSVPISLIQALNEQIRIGAPAEGAIFVDVYAAMVSEAPTLIGVDGLHPTEAGYQRIAETFFAAIRTFEGQ